ncbi:uncharacterized protein H6S33_006581 [Morchella sextelata]|uniref:uncharacterized protein n=1 Tax=Morchella sextelata TaxID=1174677 RepID=UPI001D049F99|nr:uncharacterized protein H6S33_006581 [Morchella sextelata]KAH0604913.1 hypothetical protein H6S33_006581 [Morchella sextelata]
MSRNNSVSTTETSSSGYTYPSPLYPLSTTSTSSTQTSISSTTSQENRVISDFNPTLLLYIPSHGGLRARKASAELTIHDVTTHLPGYNQHTNSIPDTVTMAQIKSVVAARRWESSDSKVPPTLVSRRNGSLSSRSKVLAPGGIEAAEWKVPWDVMKPANITLKGNEDRRVEVWCGREDRRAQVWSVGRERFVWRWLESGELVLEKESEEMGSHQIGAFLFAHHSKSSSFGPLMTTGGTLILDERGLSRTIAVTSMLILLKRERQRRSIGGRTFRAETPKGRRESV